MVWVSSWMPGKGVRLKPFKRVLWGVQPSPSFNFHLHKVFTEWLLIFLSLSPVPAQVILSPYLIVVGWHLTARTFRLNCFSSVPLHSFLSLSSLLAWWRKNMGRRHFWIASIVFYCFLFTPSSQLLLSLSLNFPLSRKMID